MMIPITAQNMLRAARAIALLALALLVGCSALPALPAAPTAADQQIVVLWHPFTGNEAEALQRLTDRYNAENARQIVLVAEYQQEIVEKLRTTSGEHYPDLVVLWPKDLQAYRQHNLIAGSAALAADVRQGRADLLPMAEAIYTVDGQLQALPLGLLTYLLYYNVDWMGDLGYDISAINWEELRRTTCAATDPTGGQVGIGFPAQAGTLLALLASGGAEIVAEDGYYNFADAAGTATGTVLHAILNGACGVVYDSPDLGMARLSNSSMAMTVESSLQLLAIEQAVATGRNFELGISRLPGIQGPGPTLWYGPGLALVSPAGSRQDAALHALGWFFSAEAQRDWAAMTNYLPVRRSLIQARALDEELGLEQRLAQITLTTADEGQWVAWPRHTNLIACRASLLRGLLSLSTTMQPEAYIATAVTACNTGVQR